MHYPLAFRCFPKFSCCQRQEQQGLVSVQEMRQENNNNNNNKNQGRRGKVWEEGEKSRRNSHIETQILLFLKIIVKYKLADKVRVECVINHLCAAKLGSRKAKAGG